MNEYNVEITIEPMTINIIAANEDDAKEHAMKIWDDNHSADIIITKK